MKCPICEKKIEMTITDYMDNILMEEHATCKDEFHFYSYEYVTGNYRESIGDIEFRMHYNIPKDAREVHAKQYSAVLELEKEFYRSKIQQSSKKGERSLWNLGSYLLERWNCFFSR